MKWNVQRYDNIADHKNAWRRPEDKQVDKEINLKQPSTMIQNSTSNKFQIKFNVAKNQEHTAKIRITIL